MNTRYRKLGFVAIAGLMAAGELLEASPALAIPITHTEADTASGTLNGVAFAMPPFVNATIVLTISNDMTDITGAWPIFTYAGTIPLSAEDAAVIFINSATVFVAQETAWVID